MEHSNLSMEEMRAVFHILPCGVLLSDAQGVIYEANRSAAKLFRTTPEKLVGTQAQACFPRLRLAAIKGGISGQNELIRAGDSDIPCVLSVHAFPAEAGRGKAFVLEALDIRQQKDRGSFAYTTIFDDLIACSPARGHVIRLAKKAANSMATVLILGESGTGKEMVARSIHNHGVTWEGPFVVINCGAIPPSLVDSELFGYDEGAFTGAKRSGHAGKFEFASGGTVFLDEIGEMPYEMQVKLLRLIQVRTLVRIGGQKIIPVNVRIIAATNKNLNDAIAGKEFRRDLYYRLNVFSLELPPLRACREDILPMARLFLEKFCAQSDIRITSFSPEAEEALYCYDWPGNVRELENAVERAVLTSETGRVELADLPCAVTEFQAETSTPAAPQGSLRHAEREAICLQLELCGGNIQKAAEKLKITRKTLYRKLREGGIDIGAYRS